VKNDRRRYKQHFPDDDILAEEGSGQRTDSKMRWIVDPLDWHGELCPWISLFCVSIAVEKDGELQAGVIYDPNRDELFTAMLGGGAIFE